MRRITQNLGLESLPASFLSGANCKGYGSISCLKKSNNGYHFLSGVSIFPLQEMNTSDVMHLSFGDKFGTVVFLYALYEDNAPQPAQLLCLDYANFMNFALCSSDEVAPPNANDWVRFNTDEFLKQNRNIDQESVVHDNVAFRLSASRVVKYLVGKKDDVEFDGIFLCRRSNHTNTPITTTAVGVRPTVAIIDECQTIPGGSDQNNGEDTPFDDELVPSSKKKRTKATKQKSNEEINWAYESHATPRKRTATVLYDPTSLEAPPKSSKKVFIDMHQLEEDEKELEAANSNKTKKKSSNAKKISKKGLKKTQTISKTPKTPTKTPTAPKTPNNSKVLNLSSSSDGGSSAGHVNNNLIMQLQQVQTANAFVSRSKGDERGEREYLRSQSLLDLDVETKRANNAFELAERANRMATSNLEVMMSHIKDKKKSKKSSKNKRKYETSSSDDTATGSSEEDEVPPSPTISVTHQRRTSTTTSTSSSSTVQVTLTQEQLQLLMEAQRNKMGRSSH